MHREPRNHLVLQLALSGLIPLAALLGEIGQPDKPMQATGLVDHAEPHSETLASADRLGSPVTAVPRQYANKPRASMQPQADPVTTTKLAEGIRPGSEQTGMLRQAPSHTPHSALPPHPERAPPFA